MVMFEQDMFGAIYRHLLKRSGAIDCVPPSALIPVDVAQRLCERAWLPLLLRSFERLLMVEMNFSEAEGLLKGCDTAQRFNYFLHEVVRENNLSALFEKYPGLWQRWCTQAHSLQQSLSLLVQRIESDVAAVAQSLYQDKAIALITDIDLVGDPHRGLQQTARIRYLSADNNKRVLYYKPRNLAIDAGFSDFMDWWNSAAPIDHRVPRVILKPHYGWAESIDHTACDSQQQLRQYYRRYGSLVGLTHIFASTDLHKDNLVANGAYPVIVDCETLFSCSLRQPLANPWEFHLYASLLLPARQIHQAVEMSPLPALDTQRRLERRVNLQLHQSNACLKMQSVPLRKSHCEVRLGSETVTDFLLYQSDLIEGFQETLLFLKQNGAAVMERLHIAMDGARIRILCASTQNYVAILNNSWHPDTLYYNCAERELSGLCTPDRPPSIAASERSQLRQGDIPYFEMGFEGTLLEDGSHNALQVAVCRNPAAKVKHQLARLCPRVITQLTADLQQALLAFRLRRGDPILPLKPQRKATSQQSNPSWLLGIAKTILDQVIAEAILAEDGSYCWRSITISADQTVQAGLSGHDLYDGASGIALAYHLIGHRTANKHYIAFSKRLASQVAQQLDEAPIARQGALTGTTGTLWALSFMQQGKLLELLPLVQRCLQKLCFSLAIADCQHYRDLDFVSGLAGTLAMLLRLDQIYKELPIAADIRRLADQLFDQIIRHARRLRNADTLIGFAHGTAGVSAVLAQFMEQMQVEKPVARRLIESNLVHETAHRSAAGWRRLDSSDEPDSSWCHGTAGIGFSRLALRRYMTQQMFETDMRIVRSRLGSPQQSLGLCHGMMADFWLEQALGETGEHALQRLRDSYQTQGLSTNFGLHGFELVGAMTGVTSLFSGAAILLNRQNF
ncbi:type 2 lanthipeptide synthetase LanM [Brucella pituitosa]|uniref:type 2 lanthipeptide synthetase LanM n=1 Tax=Brucella pituitosa TaxID=571256 RepID=UPI0013747C47|nr:type 2 lanthipeptide synthetase LanM [Brucella pituitosa]